MRWEYCVVRVRDCFVQSVLGPGVEQFYDNGPGGNGPAIPDQLRALGQEGWEAVCALPSFEKHDDYHILLKRPSP